MLASAAAYGVAAKPCRRPSVPACDPVAASIGANPTAIGDLILVKKGDVIDVGLDWSEWLEVNGGKLSASAFAAHADSPKTPTLADNDLLNTATNEAIAIVDTSSATLGDTYWLVNTVTVQSEAQQGGFVMPDRTLKRMIAVKVVA